MSRITPRDRRMMSALATGQIDPREDYEDDPPDPVDQPPRFDTKYRKRFSRDTSIEMVKHSQEHGVDAAADYFGVSPTTVKRHRATFNPESDAATTIQFEEEPVITDRVCAVMRIMHQDGKTMKEIGEKFGIRKSTVQYHISENGATCSHDLKINRVKPYNV